MNFLKKVEQYKILFEQDAPPAEVEQAPQPAPGQQPTEPAAVEPSGAPGGEEPLPESNVLLVRLLLKALVMDIDPEDVRAIQRMGDINETNASEALTKLIGIMKNYSADIDIDL